MGGFCLEREYRLLEWNDDIRNIHIMRGKSKENTLEAQFTIILIRKATGL